jgi:hypothetical protein
MKGTKISSGSTDREALVDGFPEKASYRLRDIRDSGRRVELVQTVVWLWLSVDQLLRTQKALSFVLDTLGVQARPLKNLLFPQ